MAAGVITTTTASVFLPTLWSVETVRAAEAALVAAGLIKRYDALVQSRGQTIQIPNIGNDFTAEAKPAPIGGVDTAVTFQAITNTATTLNVNKWYEVGFEIEDMAAIQANYDLRSEYSEKAGYAIARQVDTDVLNLYTGFTTVAQGTYGQDITDAVIVSTLLQVNLNDVPLENRAFIIHPNELAAIMKLDKFVKADYLGQYQEPTPVRKGPNSRYMWGEIYGVPVYYTTNLPTTAGTPTQIHNVLIHKEAWAMAMQQAPRLQAAYWLPDLAWRVVVDTIYGVVTLRAGFGVEMKS